MQQDVSGEMGANTGEDGCYPGKTVLSVVVKVIPGCHGDIGSTGGR